MWKTISSKELFKHPRITLIEDEVLLPNGHQTSYLRFEEKGEAVTIIAQRDDGKILLQKEYSYPPNQILFQFPGGGVVVGEDVKVGAQRERQEEAKVKATNLSLLGSYLLNNRRSTAKMHVFIAESLVSAPLASDIEESFEDFWLSEEEIDALISKGEIINGNVLASWVLFKNHKLNLL